MTVTYIATKVSPTFYEIREQGETRVLGSVVKRRNGWKLKDDACGYFRAVVDAAVFTTVTDKTDLMQVLAAFKLARDTYRETLGAGLGEGSNLRHPSDAARIAVDKITAYNGKLEAA